MLVFLIVLCSCALIVRADSTLGLCKLADINHRMNRAVAHDKQQVATWIENEMQRLSASEETLSTHRNKISQLDAHQESTLLGRGLAQLGGHADVLRDRVALAEREEEEARKVFPSHFQLPVHENHAASHHPHTRTH